MKSIEFRTVDKRTDTKCKCGRVTQTWISYEKQYRMRNMGRWSRWQKVPEAEKLLTQMANKHSD